MPRRNKKKPATVSCPYCRSKKVKLYLLLDKAFNLYECINCFLIFTFPQPKRAHVLEVNKDRYNSLHEKASRLAVYEEEYKRAQKHIKTLKKYKKTGRYLDVGCSYGIGVKVAQDAGFDAYGVEPAANAAMYAIKELKLKVIKNTLEEAKFKSNYFDVITLYDVLEHVPNIQSFLLEVRRILTSGGLLVIQSPNSVSYAFLLLRRQWNWLLVPNHLWHFSPLFLKDSLQKLQFSVADIKTEDGVYDFASNITSKIFSYKDSHTIFSKIIRKITYITSYVSILIGTIFWSKANKGGLLVVYAIKK